MVPVKKLILSGEPLAFFALILITVLTQIPFLMHAASYLDADEAYNAIVSQRMIHEHYRPLNIPGAPYQGITELAGTIPAQLILGAGPGAYKFSIFLAYLVLVGTSFKLLRLLGIGVTYAFWGTLPLAFNIWITKHFAFFAVGGHTTITALGTLALFCFFKYRKKNSSSSRTWLWFAGFFMGFAYYTYTLAIYYLGLFLTIGIIENGVRGLIKKIGSTKNGYLALGGFGLGYAPGILAKIFRVDVGGPVMGLADPASIFQSLKLCVTEILPYYAGVKWIPAESLPFYRGIQNLTHVASFTLPTSLKIAGHLYLAILFGFIIFVIHRNLGEIKAYLSLQKRLLSEESIMILGLLWIFGVAILSRQLHDFVHVRFLIPVLGFIPFLWCRFLEWIEQRGGRKALVVFLVFTLAYIGCHYHVYALQQGLYRQTPNAAESDMQDLIGFLDNHALALSFSEYWISHKLTYLSGRQHQSIPVMTYARDSSYEIFIYRSLMRKPVAERPYIFFTGSAHLHTWKRFSQKHDIAYQCYANPTYTVVYGMNKENTFFDLRPFY